MYDLIKKRVLFVRFMRRLFLAVLCEEALIFNKIALK